MEKLTQLVQVRKLGLTSDETSGIRLLWSASGIAFETEARDVVVEMMACSNTPQEDAFVGVFINDEMQYRHKIRAKPGKREYAVFHQDLVETVRIRLVKLTEEQYGKVWITGLITDAYVRADSIPGHHILFVGDSITAGYGVDGTDGLSAFCTEEEDVTKAYAYQVSEMLNADSRIVAYSGNGVLSRWIPPEQDMPDTDSILPEIFPYIQSNKPDLIVCNLGTNDASYVKQIPSRERAFIEKYTEFIRRLKNAFDDTKILLLYGTMEQTLSEAVRETARRCGADFLKLPMQNPKNGKGTDGHPSVVTQKEIAECVKTYIEQMMMWRP